MLANALSIIIPTYNRADHLNHCLECLARQAAAIHRVIIINDGHKDVASVIQPYRQKIFITLLITSQKGPTEARNQGLEIVETEYVAFLDDDSFACSNWVEAVLNLFNRFPSMMAQTGRLLWAAPTDKTEHIKYLVSRCRQKIYDSRHHLFQDATCQKAVLEVLALPVLPGLPGLATNLSGGNSAMRMEFIRAQGSFDPFFRTLSDREMAFRIMNQGGIIGYNPDMTVYHAHDPSFQRSLLRCIRSIPYEKNLAARYPKLASIHSGTKNKSSTCAKRMFVPLVVEMSWLERFYLFTLNNLNKIASHFVSKPNPNPLMKGHES